MHIVSLVFRLPGNFTRESDNNSLPKGSTDARSTTTPLQSVHGHLQVVQVSPPRYASVVFRQGIYRGGRLHEAATNPSFNQADLARGSDRITAKTLFLDDDIDAARASP